MLSQWSFWHTKLKNLSPRDDFIIKVGGRGILLTSVHFHAEIDYSVQRYALFYKSKFCKNAKTIEEHKKCWNPKNMRTLEAQPISTGSYKKV